MVTPTLERVAVWLDEPCPERGAFVHALEWAERLRLPLQGVATASPAGGPADACELACLRRGVRWEGVVRQGPEPLFRPAALGVFGREAAPAARRGLLARALHSPHAAALVCPPEARPMTRPLVVNGRGGGEGCYLDAAAELCRALGVAPVVLTVARTEGEAQRRQQVAEERLGGRGVPADFDCVVGCDAASAAAVVARWRRCSHLFAERPVSPPWWGWLRGHALARLLRRADGLAVLVLPGAGLPAAARQTERAAPALRWAWGAG